MIKFILAIILTCAISITLYGKSNLDSLQIEYTPTEEVIKEESSYQPKKIASYYWSDIKTLAQAPADFKQNEWLTVALLGATLTTLYHFDNTISDKISAQKGESFDLITTIGKNFGEGTYQLPIGLALYAGSLIYDDKRLEKTLFYGVETFLLSRLMVEPLKYSISRARPLTDKGADTFLGPGYTKDHNSFPSGHTQTAFALASTFALEYDSYWVSIPAYSLATATAYARVRDRKHWASDVFMGAILGYFSAKAVRKFHQKRERGWSYLLKPSDKPKLTISYSF